MKNMLGDNEALRRVWSGPLLTFLERLNGAEGEKWEEEFNRFNRKEPCWMEARKEEEELPTPPILHLLSGPDEIILPETDGKRTFAKARGVFPGYLDPDFKNWGTDVPGKPTGKMPVSVYEMRQNADFQKMFTSLTEDLDRLTLPQDKAISFVENHRKWLRTGGYATLFLFKVEGLEVEREKQKFFVADVYLDNRDDLRVGVGRFVYGRVWDGDYRRRVVIPQL